jgi:hypothetical protein
VLTRPEARLGAHSIGRQVVSGLVKPAGQASGLSHVMAVAG